MGELFLHDLGEYIGRYGCSVFIETGTGRGTGLSHALKYPFKSIFTIEINETLYAENLSRFKDCRCSMLLSDSINGLKTILPGLSEDKILFWLDAHFPGVDFQLAPPDSPYIEHITMPLIDELALIREFRPNSKDVFIIDDLNMFEVGNYELGNSKNIGKYGTVKDLLAPMENTHIATKDHRHQGFLILTPRKIAL